MYYVLYHDGSLGGRWTYEEALGSHGIVWGHKEGRYEWISWSREPDRDVTFMTAQWIENHEPHSSV